MSNPKIRSLYKHCRRFVHDSLLARIGIRLQGPKLKNSSIMRNRQKKIWTELWSYILLMCLRSLWKTPSAKNAVIRPHRGVRSARLLGTARVTASFASGKSTRQFVRCSLIPKIDKKKPMKMWGNHRPNKQSKRRKQKDKRANHWYRNLIEANLRL